MYTFTIRNGVWSNFALKLAACILPSSPSDLLQDISESEDGRARTAVSRNIAFPRSSEPATRFSSSHLHLPDLEILPQSSFLETF